MLNKIFLILGIFAIIAVIPIANAQFSMGVEAYQKSIQLTVDENNIIQTKGDHNEGQLTGSNNAYRTDETNIHEDQVIGKAIIKIPYLGWLKIWFVDLINIFRG